MAPAESGESIVTEEAAAASPEELTEDQFEILRSAVTIARGDQVRRLDTLRQRLLAHYPKHEADVDAALRYWANYEVASARREGRIPRR